MIAGYHLAAQLAMAGYKHEEATRKALLQRDYAKYTGTCMEVGIYAVSIEQFEIGQKEYRQ